jgi:hypothetical protein
MLMAPIVRGVLVLETMRALIELLPTPQSAGWSFAAGTGVLRHKLELAFCFACNHRFFFQVEFVQPPVSGALLP